MLLPNSFNGKNLYVNSFETLPNDKRFQDPVCLFNYSTMFVGFYYNQLRGDTMMFEEL